MKTIAFCGMDGSGKSTQCKVLKNRLKSIGIDAHLIHILSEGNTVSSAIQGKPIVRIFHRWLKNLPRQGILGCLKLSIGIIAFTVDAWLTYLKYSKKFKNELIIFDRYSYDQLGLFITSFPVIPWWAIKLVRILPKSDILFIFEVSPETAVARKPEEPLEKLKQNMSYYNKLATLLKKTVINGAEDMGMISNAIFSTVDNFLKNPKDRRAR